MSLKRAVMLGYSLNSVTIVLGLLRLGKEGLAQCVFSKNKTVEWPQRGPAGHSKVSEGSFGSSPKPMARQQMVIYMTNTILFLKVLTKQIKQHRSSFHPEQMIFWGS